MINEQLRYETFNVTFHVLGDLRTIALQEKGRTIGQRLYERI